MCEREERERERGEGKGVDEREKVRERGGKGGVRGWRKAKIFKGMNDLIISCGKSSHLLIWKKSNLHSMLHSIL